MDKLLLFAGVADSSALRILADRIFLCSALVETISNSKDLFLKSAVSELGFAHSMSASRSRRKVQLATAVTALSQEALKEFNVNPSKKPRLDDGSSMIMLNGQERESNAKWSKRLQDVGDRAGSYAKINLQQGDHVQHCCLYLKEMPSRSWFFQWDLFGLFKFMFGTGNVGKSGSS